MTLQLAIKILIAIIIIGGPIIQRVYVHLQKQAKLRREELERQRKVEQYLRTGRAEDPYDAAAGAGASTAAYPSPVGEPGLTPAERVRRLAEQRRAQIEQMRRSAGPRGAGAGGVPPIRTAGPVRPTVPPVPTGYPLSPTGRPVGPVVVRPGQPTGPGRVQGGGRAPTTARGTGRPGGGAGAGQRAGSKGVRPPGAKGATAKAGVREDEQDVVPRGLVASSLTGAQSAPTYTTEVTPRRESILGLVTAEDLRRAIVLQEVLGPPMGERRDGGPLNPAMG